MDPTSIELSVDYDPVTGRNLRPRGLPKSPASPSVSSSPRPFRGCDAHEKLRERTLPKKAGSKLDRASETTKQGVALSPESPSQSVEYDPLEDGSGWNVDAGAQTQFGIQIKRHFNDMRTAFLYLDTDRDGRISKQELKDICKQWMIPQSEAKRVLKAADLNNDGTLDFEEFAQRFDPFLGFEEDSQVEPINHRNPADDRPIGASGRYAWPAHEGDMETLSPVIPKESSTPASPPGSRSALEHLQKENAELIERLAEPCHQCIDLKLENAALRRRVAELEEQLARTQNEVASKAKLEHEKAERERERAAEERRWREQEQERLQREEEERAAAEKARAAAKRAEMEAREQEALQRQRETDADDEELNTVFVYGRAGSPETTAMQKALRDASIPFKNRDFDTDKRYAQALSQSGCAARIPHPPIVCLGTRAWWDDASNGSDGMFDIPFASSVAMELRHILGIRAKPMDTSRTMPVRSDADIDTEIAERYLTMQQAFLQIDYDQDGYVTKEELVAKCKEWNIPVTEAQRTISEADMDHDGMLDFDEFAKRFNPLFITKGSNGRGCYRGAAPAPTSYGSPKTPDVVDHDDARDRKERRERRTRKEECGDAKERKVCKERRENGDHKPSRESRSGEQRESKERRENGDHKPSRESRSGEQRESKEHQRDRPRRDDGEPRDAKIRRPQRSTSSSKLK